MSTERTRTARLVALVLALLLAYAGLMVQVTSSIATAGHGADVPISAGLRGP